MNPMIAPNRHRHFRVLGAATLALACNTAALAQSAAPFGNLPALPAGAPGALPNGATSITEVYADWTLECRIDNGRRQCAISQAQGDKQTGRRTFSVEIRAPRDNGAEGALLLPFGLDLEAGALIKLDDRDIARGVRFSTCIPDGCLAPLRLPRTAIDAIGKGKTLVVGALELSSNSAVALNVSLNGFAPALARLSQLGGP